MISMEASMMSALVLAGVMFIFLGLEVQDLSPASPYPTGTAPSVKGWLSHFATMPRHQPQTAPHQRFRLLSRPPQAIGVALVSGGP